MIWRALVVEIIRALWHNGLHRQNKTLQQIHEQWFPFWVEWKTAATMEDVDRQVEELTQPAKVESPIFSEDVNGETPLGGKIELNSPWNENND